MKSKNFIISLVVYPFDLMVSFGQTDEELKKSLEDVGSEWDDDMQISGVARFCMNPLNQSVLRMKVIPDTCEDYGTLQHEIFHAVTFILHRVGMKMEPLVSDEAYAYLPGILLLKFISKYDT